MLGKSLPVIVLLCACSVSAATVDLDSALAPRGPAESLETRLVKVGKDALAWLPQVELAVSFTAWAITFVGLGGVLFGGAVRMRTQRVS